MAHLDLAKMFYIHQTVRASPVHSPFPVWVLAGQIPKHRSSFSEAIYLLICMHALGHRHAER